METHADDEDRSDQPANHRRIPGHRAGRHPAALHQHEQIHRQIRRAGCSKRSMEFVARPAAPAANAGPTAMTMVEPTEPLSGTGSGWTGLASTPCQASRPKAIKNIVRNAWDRSVRLCPVPPVPPREPAGMPSSRPSSVATLSPAAEPACNTQSAEGSTTATVTDAAGRSSVQDQAAIRRRSRQVEREGEREHDEVPLAEHPEAETQAQRKIPRMVGVSPRRRTRTSSRPERRKGGCLREVVMAVEAEHVDGRELQVASAASLSSRIAAARLDRWSRTGCRAVRSE